MKPLLILLLIGGLAHADERIDRARAHFRLGQEHFKLGDFEGALREFETGYNLQPQPLFLYNIALTARRLGQLEKALEHYKKFLAVDPAARERPEVERRIADLEWALANQPRPEPPPSPSPSPQPEIVVAPPPPPPPPPPPDRRPRVLVATGFTAAALGVLALAVGGGLWSLATDENDRLSHPTRGTVFDVTVEQRRDSYQAAAVGLLVAGGVFTVAGVVVGAIGAARR